MAILKQRLMKSKGDGTFDTIHMETTSDLVLHGDKTMSTVVSDLETSINGKAASSHTHTPASIGAAASSHSHSNYVPTSRTVNGKALSSNITLTMADLGGVFYAGTSAPSDTKKLWIDTTSTTGGLKYHNGSSWVHVPVAYT